MKVSEKLPPVLMRQYRSESELMAVFTRPAAHSALSTADFDYVGEDVKLLCGLLREAVARKEPGVNILLYGPARHRQDRTRARGGPRPPGWSCSRWSTPTATATR